MALKGRRKPRFKRRRFKKPAKIAGTSCSELMAAFALARDASLNEDYYWCVVGGGTNLPRERKHYALLDHVANALRSKARLDRVPINGSIPKGYERIVWTDDLLNITNQGLVHYLIRTFHSMVRSAKRKKRWSDYQASLDDARNGY